MRKDQKRFMRNFLAFCIDSVYLLILAEIVFLSLLAVLRTTQNTTGVQTLVSLTTGQLPLIYFLIGISLNAMIQESFFGKTLGKKMMGLIITNKDYGKPSIKQIIIRNLVYSIDNFFIIGGIGLRKKKGRCLGDILSGSQIVDKNYLIYRKEVERDQVDNINILLPEYLLRSEWGEEL